MTDAEILQLVASGADLDQIAAQSNISAEQASRMLAAAADRADSLRPGPNTSTLVELRHLDLLRRALTPAALRGEARAAQTLLRIATLRAALTQRLRRQPVGRDALTQLDTAWKDRK